MVFTLWLRAGFLDGQILTIDKSNCIWLNCLISVVLSKGFMLYMYCQNYPGMYIYYILYIIILGNCLVMYARCSLFSCFGTVLRKPAREMGEGQRTSRGDVLTCSRKRRTGAWVLARTWLGYRRKTSRKGSRSSRLLGEQKWANISFEKRLYRFVCEKWDQVGFPWRRLID